MRTHTRLRILLHASLLLPVSCPFLGAQCVNRIWQTAAKSKSIAGFQSAVPAGMQPHFAAQLNDVDWLIIYESQKPREEDAVAHDEGFVIARNGRRILNQALMAVPAWKSFAKSMDEKLMPAFAVSMAQLCNGQGQTVAIAFQACCSSSSGILYLLVSSDGDTHRTTALPIVGGGKLELFSDPPLKVRLWNEMYETCAEKIESDACPRKFHITEYQIWNRLPVFVKQSVSSRRYSPGDFDSHRIELLSTDR